MASSLRGFRAFPSLTPNTFRLASRQRSSRQNQFLQSATAAPSPRGFHSTRPRMVVHNIRTAAEFKEAIAKNDYVMVDCFATWCGPCKAIAPIVTQYSNVDEFGSLHFAKFDVDELPEIATEYSVRAMPTFLFFKKGEKKHEFVGADPKELLSSLIDFAADKY